jgi:hypothetical protein
VFLVKLFAEGVFKDLRTPCQDDRMLIVLCIPLFTTILATTLIRRIKPEEEVE